MKKINIILLTIVLLTFLSTSLVIAETFDPKSEDDCLYYFYGKDCKDCQDTNALLTKIQTEYPNLEVKQFEVYHNANNEELLTKYFKAYNIPQAQQGIPAVFTKNSYLIGKTTLSNYLENVIIDNDNAICPNLDASNVVGIANEKEPQHVLNAITTFSVVGSVIKDAFRPIMIAIILILILCLATFKDVPKAVIGGALFIVGSFTAFLLYGTNIIDAWGDTHTQLFFYKALAIIAITVSIIKIGSFFLFKKDYIQSLQKEQRIKAQNMLNIAYHPSWLLPLGFILSMFALTNTGKMFSMLRVLHSEGLLSSQVTPWIVYATIIMIIPIIATVIVMSLVKTTLESKSTSTEPYSDKRINEWRDHNHKMLNVVLSLLVIVISLFVLYV